MIKHTDTYARVGKFLPRRIYHQPQDGRRKEMQITDIKVRKLFNEGPMRAIVSVTFDGQLAVHDIKVINARDRYFIVMPSRKNPDETFRDIVHPINAEFRSTLEAQVLAAYEEALAVAEAEADSTVFETEGAAN